MATTNHPRGSTSDAPRKRSGNPSASISSPVSNEAYRVIRALHAKLDVIEACRTYGHGADEGLWQSVAESDAKGVELLLEHLEMMVAEGRLRRPAIGH